MEVDKNILLWVEGELERLMVLKNDREGKVIDHIVISGNCKVFVVWDSSHEKMWCEQNACAYIEILKHFSSSLRFLILKT